MHMFQLLAGVCSILSLLVSLFVATRVMQINQQIKVMGKKNIVAGRDIRGPQ